MNIYVSSSEKSNDLIGCWITNLYSCVGDRKRVQTFILKVYWPYPCVQNNPITLLIVLVPALHNYSFTIGRVSKCTMVNLKMHFSKKKKKKIEKKKEYPTEAECRPSWSSILGLVCSVPGCWDVLVSCTSCPSFLVPSGYRRNLASLHHLSSLLSSCVSTLFIQRVAAGQGSVPHAAGKRVEFFY